MEYRVNILKNRLESIKFDIILNNPVNSCEKCYLCNQVEGKKKDEPWFKYVCYQLVRNLQISEFMNRGITADKRKSRCNSLMYWTYDKVKNFYEKPVINNNEKIVEELLGVWKNFYNSFAGNVPSSICSVPTVSEFKNLEDMKRKKIMSDYCENYSILKGISNYTFFANCQIYYDYFKDSLSKYKEETIKGCNAKDFIINNCSDFCSNADPDNVIENSKCKTIEILPGKNDYIEKGKCDTLRDQAVAAQKCESKEIRISEFTFSDNRAIILILFSLWGIFLTFLFLYKMIPLRSWISNKLGKKIIIRDNFNEQSDNELFDGDYESMDGNMQSTGYNLTYNSDWSSSR
ncbi:PIR Superfamily Protein [Plasmodium ovale curtisi]|uniref:PIR Superfamily Protein n=1 Tax=Plasmodium ovale curtisi TaxID=864141 RepID=A0A1A8XBE5_PLAOA|nr:PIR Superfamily Protein [Plasmodium ovale curtisi]